MYYVSIRENHCMKLINAFLNRSFISKSTPESNTSTCYLWERPTAISYLAHQIIAHHRPLSNSPSATNFLGSNPPPRSLGSEGGLFQTIQQGSAAGLGGIHQQLSPPSSSGLGLSNYPTNSGNVPSSLSSSGSLATLGIAVPSSFDSPSSSDHVNNNNNPSLLSGGDTATIAPAIHPNKETGRTGHQNHGIYLFLFSWIWRVSISK